MTRRYKLDESQRDRVQAVIRSRLEVITAARNELRAQVVAQHKVLQGELRDILDSGQYAAWQKDFEERRHRHRYPQHTATGQRQKPGAIHGSKGFRLMRIFDRNADHHLSPDELPEPIRDSLMSADKDDNDSLSIRELSIHLGFGPPREPRPAKP